MTEARLYYVVLVKRAGIDHQPWPRVFASKTVAEDCEDRVTDLREVRFDASEIRHSVRKVL